MGRGRKVCARAVGPACLASGSESGHVRGGVAVGGAGAPGAPVGLGGGAPWSSACGTFTERRQGGDRLGSSAPADFTLSTYRVTGRGRAGQGKGPVAALASSLRGRELGWFSTAARDWRGRAGLCMHPV